MKSLFGIKAKVNFNRDLKELNELEGRVMHVATQRPYTSPAHLDQISPELCRLYDKSKFAFKKYLGSISGWSPDLHV